MSTTVDTLIIGAGIVGLTAALQAAQAGQSVAVVEAKSEQALLAEKPFDARWSALNAKSQKLLEQLNVWEAIQHKARVETMQVWDEASGAQIEFDAGELGVNRLATIVKNHAMVEALYATCKKAGVAFHFEKKASDVEAEAKQIIVADGANSKTREQLGIGVTQKSYEHTALVAVVKTEKPHGNIARQTFLPNGPLALLPMPDANQCSIVWSTTEAEAKKLLEQDENDFNAHITASLQNRLGKIKVLGGRQAFPLFERMANEFVHGKYILVGDAAHTLHPLAGLGLNLGLGDVAHLNNLSTYEKDRKAENKKMQRVMQALKAVYANEHLLPLRGLGVDILNRSSWLKQQVFELVQ